MDYTLEILDTFSGTEILMKHWVLFAGTIPVLSGDVIDFGNYRQFFYKYIAEVYASEHPGDYSTDSKTVLNYFQIAKQIHDEKRTRYFKTKFKNIKPVNKESEIIFRKVESKPEPKIKKIKLAKLPELNPEPESQPERIKTIIEEFDFKK